MYYINCFFTDCLDNGKIIQEKKRLTYCRPPRNLSELIYAYLHSYDGSIFITENLELEKGSFNSEKVKDILFQDRVENLFNGAVSQVVSAAARVLKNNKIIFPYSMPSMVECFRYLQLSMKGFFKPKEYLYRLYIDIGKKYGLSMRDFSYKSQIKKDYHDAAMDILTKTKYGEMLKEQINIVGNTGIQNLSMSLFFGGEIPLRIFRKGLNKCTVWQKKRIHAYLLHL